MQQVKTFKSGVLSSVENEINVFLKENIHYKVISVEFVYNNNDKKYAALVLYTK
ncbi:hypothetical protein ACG59Z_01060 [Acinetobacter sp. ABJ_C1_1]|uniref:hypothetical protein n=1 Tax=Acinetobacter sp. ABJ_C1_1 TaxID=3378321 RepID=UPI0037DDD9AF